MCREFNLNSLSIWRIHQEFPFLWRSHYELTITSANLLCIRYFIANLLSSWYFFQEITIYFLFREFTLNYFFGGITLNLLSVSCICYAFTILPVYLFSLFSLKNMDSFGRLWIPSSPFQNLDQISDSRFAAFPLKILIRPIRPSVDLCAPFQNSDQFGGPWIPFLKFEPNWRS